jgi:T5SS/PEP-CTERM-associated repeat protein
MVSLHSLKFATGTWPSSGKGNSTMKNMMWITVAAVLLANFAGGPVLADEYYWNSPAGGSFGGEEYWNDGESGVPDSDDVAIFDLEAVYPVYFAGDHTTDRALIRSGQVSMRPIFPELPATYTLLNPSTATPALVVGHGGRDIAWLRMSDLTVHTTNMTIGHLPDGTGHVLHYSTTPLSLLIDQNLIVGNEGIGEMEMYEATMTSATGTIGLAASGSGDVTLGGSGMQWTCDGPLTVGLSGEGALALNNGGTISCHDAVIAQHEDSAGAVTPGSGQWLIDGTLDVGMSGFGTLDIDGGADVINHTFATIGTYDSWPYGNGGVGEVTVDDVATWTIDGDLYIGFFGAGSLAVLGDIHHVGSVSITGDALIGLNYVSTLMLSGGGTIAVDGDLTNYDHEFDRLVIEIYDPDDYPTPAIDAGGTIDSFEPEVTLDYYYEPQVGDTFAIAHADGGLGTFSFIVPELPDGQGWEVIQDEHDVSLTIVVDVEGDVNGDGVVDTADLLQLLAAWGDCPGCPEDVNGDDVVNTADLLILLANWTP